MSLTSKLDLPLKEKAPTQWSIKKIFGTLPIKELTKPVSSLSSLEFLLLLEICFSGVGALADRHFPSGWYFSMIVIALLSVSARMLESKKTEEN